jgi:recombination protein RecA
MAKTDNENKVNDSKAKSLELAMKTIEKSFGKNALVRLGDKTIEKIDKISTGSIAIDNAIGIGGIPKGRVIEIYGPESSGKTTLTLQIAAECQKAGGIVAFIDAEHALDVAYAKNLGVDVDNLLVSQPDYGEQALDIADTIIKSGSVDLVIIDSVAALTPKVELDGEMDDQQVGVQARLMSKALRKMTASINQTQTTVIFINQLRMKIGMMGYGSPETTTGGNALKFYASVRIDVRAISTLKKNEEAYGKVTKVKIVKNKVAPPFKEVQVDLIFGEGFSPFYEIINFGVKNEIIEKSGSWFSYGDTKLGQGMDKVVEFFKSNPDKLAEVKAKVLKKLGI